jgi:hypothetical protein
MELSAGAVLHAVDGPRPPVIGERAVIARMPIARRNDERHALGEPVDRTHDGVPVRHRERPAGAEVILDIDHDQSLHRSPI